MSNSKILEKVLGGRFTSKSLIVMDSMDFSSGQSMLCCGIMSRSFMDILSVERFLRFFQYDLISACFTFASRYSDNSGIVNWQMTTIGQLTKQSNSRSEWTSSALILCG